MAARRRALALAVALATGGSACAQIFGFSDPPPVDGDLDASGVLVTEGQAPGGDDAGADARSISFCGQHPDAALCADFEGDDVLDGWQQRRGDVARVTDFVASGLGAARVRTTDAGGCGYGDLSTQVRGTAMHGVHVEISLRPGPAEGGSENAGLLSVAVGGCTHIVSTNGNSGDIQSQQSGSFNLHNAYAPFPRIGVYSHLVLDIDDSAGSAKLTLAVDGKVAFQADPLALDGMDSTKHHCGVSGTVTVTAGEFCVTGTHESRMDDIVIELK